MDSYDIYEQYYQRVKRFILSSVRDEWVADDLTQETFIRVQKNLETVQDPSKIASWIFRIAYNLCQDYFRRQKRILSNECEFNETTGGLQEAIAQKKLEQCEMNGCIQKVVGILPEPLRIVITLFDMAELSHREIAEILETTVDNVKVRLHRARKKLKVLLEERCAFEVDERNVLICAPLDGDWK